MYPFFYTHWRLLKPQSQDILTGQLRLRRGRNELQMARVNVVSRESSFCELEWQLRRAPRDDSCAVVFRNSIFKSITAAAWKYLLKTAHIASCQSNTEWAGVWRPRNWDIILQLCYLNWSKWCFCFPLPAGLNKSKYLEKDTFAESLSLR